MSTPTINKTYDAVCEALLAEHTEENLWKLAEQIAKVAPSGVESVEKIVAEAKLRGIPTKSANTLRLYRDVALRFPESKRVKMVSFSAHREALGGLGDADTAAHKLTELAAKHGAAGVTVKTVKDAIGAATGKVKAAPATAGKAQTSYADLATDLAQHRAKRTIGELDAMLQVQGVTLDNLHAGVSAFLAAIEARRAKAARKAAVKPVNPATNPVARKAVAAARNGASKPQTKATVSNAPRAKAGSKAGDLRDL